MTTSSSNIKQAVQKQFAHVASNYSTSAVHAKGKDLQAMVDCISLNKSMWVLDAGCGAGHTALAFAPFVSKVVAYDFTPAMLEQVEQLAAERGIVNITTRQGDVESLPFADASFDLVVSRYSAHHWPHPQAALSEFVRILKPGGQFILSDIIAAEDFTQDTFLQTLEVLRDPSHVRDHSISQWQAMLRDAGFQSEIVFQHDVILHFANWVERMATPGLNQLMLKSLFAGASADVKQGFHLPDNMVSNDFEFIIPGAVLRGWLK